MGDAVVTHAKFAAAGLREGEGNHADGRISCLAVAVASRLCSPRTSHLSAPLYSPQGYDSVPSPQLLLYGALDQLKVC